MSTALDDATGVTGDAAQGIAGEWSSDLAAALESGDATGAAALFQPDGWWRDLLAFTWDLSTVQGPDAIAARLGSGPGARWFMGGNLHQSRHHSQFLALQIKAIEEGLIPRAGPPGSPGRPGARCARGR